MYSREIAGWVKFCEGVVMAQGAMGSRFHVPRLPLRSQCAVMNFARDLY